MLRTYEHVLQPHPARQEARERREVDRVAGRSRIALTDQRPRVRTLPNSASARSSSVACNSLSGARTQPAPRRAQQQRTSSALASRTVTRPPSPAAPPRPSSSVPLSTARSGRSGRPRRSCSGARMGAPPPLRSRPPTGKPVKHADHTTDPMPCLCTAAIAASVERRGNHVLDDHATVLRIEQGPLDPPLQPWAFASCARRTPSRRLRRRGPRRHGVCAHRHAATAVPPTRRPEPHERRQRGETSRARIARLASSSTEPPRHCQRDLADNQGMLPKLRTNDPGRAELGRISVYRVHAGT